MKKFFKRTFKQHRHPSKNSNDHPCEEKQACHPDSPKASSSDDHSTTVNNFYYINNSCGVAVGEQSKVTDNSFNRHEQSAARDDVSSRKLRDELRHQARKCSQEIQPAPIQLERSIVPVSLQIAREPVRVPNVLQADGHLHRRKDILKFYEHPPGDISEQEMFDLPKQQAQQEANWKEFEYEADKTEYIKKHGNILAVIGWPGIGKTTSMKKWINQIRNGELVSGVTYVFFIFVRHIDFSKKMTVFQFLLSTIIPNWEHSTESDKAWLKKLFSDPNVLIALEGLDESAVKDLTMSAPKLNLYDTADPLDIMLNLMGGNLLPLARIVISSRPDQLFHLHAEHRPKCIIQILGLNKDAQDELGHQIWGDRYKLAKVILDDNPDTFAYCFVPVNFLLTVDYLMNESEVDSVCMTRVLASGCKKYAVSDHLHGKECDLDKLSKLAWNGYKKMQIVFEEADLEEANIDKNTLLSFLNRSVTKSANIKMTIMDGDKRSSFSHLIWQEFMVAVHLLHYSIDDFDQQLKHIHKDRWEMVSKFLFGLCNKDVFDIIRSFKGSCSKNQWLDKRDQLKKVAIRRMKSLNKKFTAHQDVESSENQSLSVTGSETSSEYEQPVMSPCLQSTAYSCQQLTTNQNLQLVSNEYEHVAPNEYQMAIANQVPLFNPPHQSVSSPYEQQAANQHAQIWERSHQQMVPQLNQSLMTSQSQQLSSNQFMSNQPLCYSHYPSHQAMLNDYQQFVECQPEVCANKCPPLAGTSYQQHEFNLDKQLTANPTFDLLTDQHQLLSPNQFATNTNQQVPANLHPTSTHYQQVAANSDLGFASNQHHAVKPHHPNSSQAPLAATHQFQENSSTEFQPNPLQHVPLTHHLQQLAAKSLHDDDHLQQRETESDEDSSNLSEDLSNEDSSNLSEEDPSDDDSEWKILLQVCSWIHETNDENFAQDVVSHLPDHIEFPQFTTILPSDVSNVFYALRSSPKSHTLGVDNCNFSGDSLKLFSKEVSSSNIKIQRFWLVYKKLNDGDFSSVVEISQHVEELLWLNSCEITSCRVSSLAEKFSETGHKIQWLNLGGNNFDDQGLVNLVLCLKNIQKLDLWNCDISSAGCAKFAEKFIETGHKLKLLDLSFNELIGDGARSLIPCLHLIELLGLERCNVTEAVKEEIRSELKRLGLPEHRVIFKVK